MNACRYAVQRRERRVSLCTTAGTRGTTGRVCAMHRGRKPLTCAELWNQKSRSNSANQWIRLFCPVLHIAGSVNSGQAATLRLTSSAWESLQAEPDTLRTRWDTSIHTSPKKRNLWPYICTQIKFTTKARKNFNFHRHVNCLCSYCLCHREETKASHCWWCSWCPCSLINGELP